MSLRCSNCERRGLYSQSRSHSMRITKRRLKLNLQPAKDECGKRTLICTKCRKTKMKKKK